MAARPGITTEEPAELKRLRLENAELRRAKPILKTSSALFAASSTGQTRDTLSGPGLLLG